MVCESKLGLMLNAYSNLTSLLHYKNLLNTYMSSILNCDDISSIRATTWYSKMALNLNLDLSMYTLDQKIYNHSCVLDFDNSKWWS